ncbi:hypothetical protein C8R42DRAFT_694050 [Lentinula raphanica]|nr:hypothetical protein C8R42DRAFT_694050 [Lentinula raphanica]
MVNFEGNNQWGPKNYPADDILSAELHQYAKERLSVDQRLARLKQKFNLDIGKCKLMNLNNTFKVPSPRKLPREDVATQAVLEKVAQDSAQRNGTGTIMTLLDNEGMDFVCQVLAQHVPEGLVLCFPGKRPGIKCSSLMPQGLASLGGVGLPIYGIKDQWSSFILHLVVVPNNRLATTIGHVHLDCVEKYEFIPITFVMDKGSETRYVFANQTGLREAYAQDIDTEKYPPAYHLWSVHNTPIEGLWHWFTNVSGINAKDELLRGGTSGIYHPGNDLHINLFNWLWPQVLQKHLDNFTEYWNNHRIRYQADKPNASGTTPQNAFTLPKSVAAGAEECRIDVDRAVVDALRNEIPVSREDAMRFMDDDFAARALAIYEAIGDNKLRNAKAENTS